MIKIVRFVPSKDQVQRLVKELKADGLIDFKGKTKASLWFPIAPK